MLRKRKCQICNKEVLINSFQKKRNKFFYCSRICYNKRKVSDETKKKLHIFNKGKHWSPNTELKKGHKLNLGEKYSSERIP